MTEETAIALSSVSIEATREVARQEARAALVTLLDQDLATLRLGEELGIPPRELAHRSARVTLTGARDEERPLVMVVSESEGHLHEVVDTLRAPVSIRYKTVTHAPSSARPELPPSEESAPTGEQSEAGDSTSASSKSSNTEGEPA